MQERPSGMAICNSGKGVCPSAWPRKQGRGGSLPRVKSLPRSQEEAGGALAGLAYCSIPGLSKLSASWVALGEPPILATLDFCTFWRVSRRTERHFHFGLFLLKPSLYTLYVSSCPFLSGSPSLSWLSGSGLPLPSLCPQLHVHLSM